MALSCCFAVLLLICTATRTLASPYLEGDKGLQLPSDQQNASCDLYTASGCKYLEKSKRCLKTMRKQIRYMCEYTYDLPLYGQLSDEGLSNGTCVCLSESFVLREQASSRSAAILPARSSECFRFNGALIIKDEEVWCQVRMRRGTQTGWVPYQYLEVAPKSACSLRKHDVITRDDTSSALDLSPVSLACLTCICLMESECKPIGCSWDVTSLSCGYYQIKEAYWIDCGKPGRDWKTCAEDLQCASQCVQNYMARYASHYKCPMTCEGFAREHDGGPSGCHSSATIAYWDRLQEIPWCRSQTLD